MKLKRLIAIVIMISVLQAGCAGDQNELSKSYSENRANFTTKIIKQVLDGTPVQNPPEGVLEIVKYNSPIGEMSAYIVPDPVDGKKHPAVLWISGGFGNSIDGLAWEDAPEDNDQSGSAFWKAGIITMYPSFRGGNDNPGYNECLYGEVDDVIAAAKFLAELPYVDPDRIYLAGHSTGGTLALLVSETSSMFRAVFAFGPVDKIQDYPNKYLIFENSNQKEYDLRSPVLWLDSIKNRTFVIEGEGGNASSLRDLRSASKNDLISFKIIQNKNHFNILAPVTKLIAEKINADIEESVNINIEDYEIK